MNNVTVSEMSRMLSAQAESVARYLLPAGKRHGREWCAGSIHGEAGESLKVCVDGGRMGVWSDFATGDAGDLVDLWRMSRGLSARQTIQEVKDYLGIRDEQPFAIKKKKEYIKPVKPQAKKIMPDSPMMAYLKGRGLTEEVIAAYQVGYMQKIPSKFKMSKEDWLVLPFKRDELIGVKYMCLHRDEKGKKLIVAEGGCEPILFGWQAIPENARSIVICEGEIDAMSLAVYGFHALSVPFGGGGGNKQQWIDCEWQHLERFDEIYLCMDNDQEGHDAAVEIASRLGAHRCKVVKLPHKDANQCLQEEVPVSYLRACFEEAETNDPEELRAVVSFTGDIVEYFYPKAGKRPGFDLPWKKVGSLRIHHGEVSVWTGFNGHGKSVFLGQAMMAAAHQGERVCIASLEMPPPVTFARMVKQVANSATPTEGTILDIVKDWHDQFWVFNLVGTGKIERMLKVFEYAFRRYGVRQFVVDSLLKLGLAESDYDGQKLTVEKLCDFANEFNVSIHLVAHARKQGDEFAPPNKMDIRGSGAITDQVDNVFCVFRNKKKEIEIRDHLLSTDGMKGEVYDKINEQYDALLICDKCRDSGEKEGRWGLFFNRSTLVYSDETVPVFDSGEFPKGWVK